MQDFHKIFAHVIRFFGGSVVSLAVLQETEEDGIDGHRVYRKESGRDEEGRDRDYDDWCKIIIHDR